MFKSFLKIFTPKTYQSIFNSGFNSGKIKGYEEMREERKQNELKSFEFEHEIGKMIIAVPNEYDDIIYGEIIGHGYIGVSPVAYVYDYLRKEKLLLLQKVYPYKECFAKALSNLNPNERHILIYRSEKNFSSINESTIIGWKETKEVLEKNGFFKKLEEKK